ncbi:MAG: hypothetical protein JWN34_6015 [Bryobacterales bacterium]|nr:hypothetical protein [Bryobacterales bacterium]
MGALYSGRLSAFINAENVQLLGTLTGGLAREGFDTTRDTTFSWEHEFVELQTSLRDLAKALPASAEWTLLLEYILPVVGQRIDCVLLADDIIYVIEYKCGESTTGRAALQQAQDYALNLADFHEESRGRRAIPIAVGSFRGLVPVDLKASKQGAAVKPEGLASAMCVCHRAWGNRQAPIESTAWERSRYFPVPTMIEAASAIYRNHDVRELAHSRAGIDNLELTQTAVTCIVREARNRGTKKLILITGVPGAGKTLAGLNVVQHLANEMDLDNEQASFLSGNGPLVKVLQEALVRSVGRRSGVSTRQFAPA